MATLTVSNLCPSGTELFMDVESFMHDMNDEEMIIINGGTSSPIVVTGVKVASRWLIGGAILGAAAAIVEAVSK